LIEESPLSPLEKGRIRKQIKGDNQLNLNKLMGKSALPPHMRQQQLNATNDMSYRLSISYLTGHPLGQSMNQTNMHPTHRGSIYTGGDILTPDLV
jgi:hypothetical protein